MLTREKIDNLERLFNIYLEAIDNPQNNFGAVIADVLLSTLKPLYPDEKEEKEEEPKNEELPDFGKERWISLLEFYRRYPNLCTPDFLGKFIKKHGEDSAYFSMKTKCKLWVKPKKTLYFMHKFGGVKIERRATEILTKLGLI